MCGSVFISEFSFYNFERKFCSYNEYEALDSSLDPLNWYEIDCEKGISVTSLDVLPSTGWITVGYSDGTVKLLQSFKVTRPQKGGSGLKTESGDNKNVDSITFGLMADAVSSAFSGIKKTSSQTLCSTDVFNDSVLNCKFTFAESYEEIICSNLKSIAILTYSKNVLSHNLNVNYLQSLNERLENDQIVDIVCLSSNPQAKFITGVDVGGICAILTFRTCLVFSTRPRLSIIMNLTLEKLNKSLSPDQSQLPSVTWMIYNIGKKNIKPLLLISLGNQVRFIQCNIQTVKGSPSMSVLNIGTMQFRHPIRCIRIVTRLILAVVDNVNCMHIVQLNLSQMYYDIIRTVDLVQFSNKMELGIEFFDPLWLIQPSLMSGITVFSKTVKMVAKGYKKFSNLVSDLFQGKKHTSSFELKNFTVLILVPNGVVGVEVNSWIKVIGELSASKMFCEALSIIQALSDEWIPGLFDFRAFKNNLNQLILYILHQSSAHIIKLSKFVNENISTNLLNLDSEGIKSDFWNTKVKSDVYDQINALCCSMVDSCVSSNLYEPLNDLIFRCFATINLEHVFVKYILLNYYNSRISLEVLNSQIIESICQTYEVVLDNMHEHVFLRHDYLEDEILFIDKVINTHCVGNDLCDIVKLYEVEDDIGCMFNRFEFDPRLLSYIIICNNLSKIQLYCFKNNVITDTNKAVSRLSRHFTWHCLIYCQSVVLDDYSNLLTLILSHAETKFDKLRLELTSSESEGFTGLSLPYRISENLFVVRVFYSILESFLTFDNCGLSDTIDTSNYCNIISYLTSTGNKTKFPIESKTIYAKETLLYDLVTIDYEKIEKEQFNHEFEDSESTVLFKLLKISPRLLFVCLENLFNCNDKFDYYQNEIGSKLSTFNYLLNLVISATYEMERLFGFGSVDQILKMVSFLFLSVSSTSDSLYLNLNTSILSIYKLLTIQSQPFHSQPKLYTGCSKDLIDNEGYFNNGNFHNVFYRPNPQYNQDCVMIITPDSVDKLIYKFLKKLIYDICSKLNSPCELGQNSHFTQLVRMCREFIPLTSSSLKFFFYQITGDFHGIISDFDRFNMNESIFTYLYKCIEYMSLRSQEFTDDIEHLLLMDLSNRKSFVSAVMKNLPGLISLDLNKVTNLLIQIFSLMDITKTLDSTLETSPETILNTLENLPDLQILVLDALLKSKSSVENTLQLPNSYFNRYLNLLCIHDKSNVSNFLKRQKSLNISYCLKVCRDKEIDEAVIYLLLRAGNVEQAVELLISSFSHNVKGNLNICSTLVQSAHNICQEFQNQISYQIIENMWFSMLKCSIQQYDIRDSGLGDDVSRCQELKCLVEEIFSDGILKYVKFSSALTEITKYDSNLKLFKKPLHNLLSDFQLQTYIANTASEISKTLMNREFRSRQVFNNRGITINSVNKTAKINRNLICFVCRRSLVFKVNIENDTIHKSEKFNRNQKVNDELKMTNIEEQVGTIQNVPIQGEKTNSGNAENANFYNDRLSSLVSKRKVNKGLNNTLSPSFIQSIYTHSDPFHNIIVYWCNHSFHKDCAPTYCPICNVDE